jgi:hypothetical protein
MLTLSDIRKFTFGVFGATAVSINGLIFPQSADASIKGSQFHISHQGTGSSGLSELYLDIFGDNLPSNKTKIHLWDHKEKSNLFVQGPDQNSGNELRSAQDPEVCLGTDGDTNSKPEPGTPLIAKRDCANAFNFKYDGQSWHVGKFPDICIDINQNKAEKWEPVQLYPCNGSPAQHFENVLGSKAGIQAAKPISNGSHNACFETDRDEQRDDDGEFIITHHNNCGDTYIYMSPKKAIVFSRDLKNGILDASEIGAGLLVVPFIGPVLKGVTTTLTGVLALGYQKSINDLDACSSLGKNAWFRTKQNGAFPSVSCD